uniref:Uncharacterized protein n=1 Tax=Anguilla anguilla TaxID=7936 RepID=A0A0E9UEV5_ANGAN
MGSTALLQGLGESIEGRQGDNQGMAAPPPPFSPQSVECPK